MQSLPVLPNAYYIPVAQIEANPFQPRQNFSESELAELADSIRSHGVLQPIVVRPHPDKPEWFQLVSGERRLRACRMIGRGEISGIVRNLSDIDSAKVALQENIQRKSLTDWEESRGIEALWAAYEKSGVPMSKRAIARELNMSLTYVSNRLDALGYREDVQELLGQHRGVLSSARAINAIDDEERRARYLNLVNEGQSFLDITTQIQRDNNEIKAIAQASTAPDLETENRSQAVARGETGAVSRGRQLSGTSKSEANAETQRHIQGLEAWVTQCDDKTFSQALDLARRIMRGDLSR